MCGEVCCGVLSSSTKAGGGVSGSAIISPCTRMPLVSVEVCVAHEKPAKSQDLCVAGLP